MERKLASIQVIHDVLPIEGADNLELVKVLGWQCVTKKGDFKRLDKCVYFEIDSFLPLNPTFEFLRKYAYKKLEDGREGILIKTIKLRGCLSQGLVMPLSILPEGDYERGMSVAAILGVSKYEISEKFKAGKPAGLFPYFIPKTDETRVQSEPDVIGELKGLPYYITCKMDGTSATFCVKGGEFFVCSRNLQVKEDDESVYWKIARKYDLKSILEVADKNGSPIAIQGEICGPGIQKNPAGLSAISLFVFNVFDVNKGLYIDYMDLLEFCAIHRLPMVPIVAYGEAFSFSTVDELIEEAKGTYTNGKTREGIVIRPQSERWSPSLKGRLSFKVINNDYLLGE